MQYKNIVHVRIKIPAMADPINRKNCRTYQQGSRCQFRWVYRLVGKLLKREKNEAKNLNICIYPKKIKIVENVRI